MQVSFLRRVLPGKIFRYGGSTSLSGLKSWQMWKRLVVLAALCPVALRAANIGSVVNVIGQAADLVYDSQRNQVYISNLPQNRVEVYSVAQQRLLSPINVSTFNSPAGLAISADNSTLYVANNLTSGSITLVNLTSQTLADDIPVNSRPDSITLGNDGQVVIMGSSGLLRLNPATRTVTSVPNSPPGSAAPGPAIAGALPIPQGFRASLAATPDGRLIFGLSTSSATVSRVFVYEVASGTVLRSRNVLGMNAATAASPDGSKFMMGPSCSTATRWRFWGAAASRPPRLPAAACFHSTAIRCGRRFPRSRRSIL